MVKSKFGVYTYPVRRWTSVPEGTNYSQLQGALSRGTIIHHSGKYFMTAESEQEWKDYMNYITEALQQDRINQQKIFEEARAQDTLRRMEYQAQTNEFQNWHLYEARRMFKEEDERVKEQRKEKRERDNKIKKLKREINQQKTNILKLEKLRKEKKEKKEKDQQREDRVRNRSQRR